MIRNPNFHIQVRKRKWKTVLFLLRKRKRKSEPDNIQNPNFVHHNHHNQEEDVYFDAVNDEGDIRPVNDVVVDKIEENENENLTSLGGLGNDEGERSKSEFSETRNKDGGDEKVANEEEDLSLGKEQDESLKSGALVVSETRRKDGGDKPPDDDCCPICFENFTIACKTNCGHWFCANCILRFWTYRTALQKCNCPICARPISKLTPEASLLTLREVEVVEVLKNVQRYNCLFQGGVNGVIRKLFEVPNVFKRMLCCLMDPDRFRGNYYAMRSLALLMSCIYNISSFDFIPTGALGVRRLFDLCAIALVVILCLVGVCHRLLLRRRVRRLAATQL